MSEKVLKAVKDARSNSKRRNFSQTFDLIVNVKLIDLKKPENRLNETFVLPKGRGKEASVVVFSDSMKDEKLKIYKSAGIEGLGADKRALKKLARETDFFLSEPKLMPLVGRVLGRVLAPRGKMPSVMSGATKQMIARYKETTAKLGSKALAENPGLIARGVFVEEERPEYCAAYDRVIAQAMREAGR